MSDQWRIFLSFLIVIAFFFFMFDRMIPKSVDALYVNGTIYTMDRDNSVVDAIAVRGERIVDVGSENDLRTSFKPKRIIDLQGKPVFPGFIDSHAHLLSLGIARITVDLVGSVSEQEAVGRVKRRATNLPEEIWVRGRGWDQNDWPVKKFPDLRSLDRVSPRNPVYLTRIDGHAAWVNSRALELAGINRETEDPPGGRIIKDASGNPTGVLIDEAMKLVSGLLIELSEEETKEVLEIAVGECLSYGLTTIHDMGVTLEEIALYKNAIDKGAFPIRVYAAASSGETWKSVSQTGPLIGYGGNRLSVRAVKVYTDGALGSSGAALLEPYSDEPTNRGLTRTSEEDFLRTVQEALQKGFQVCTHAIGDRGNTITLDVYERALRENPRNDARLRVEHAQVLAPADIPRFKDLGVLPSMQPTHCTSDMYWAEARLGPSRIRGAYAWRSLRETGVMIPGGSDFPVEHANPLYGIYAFVTRQDHQGIPRNAEDVRRYFQLSAAGIADPASFDGGWYGSQKLTREEAVRSFTLWGAWAGFEEDLKGSLEADKLADFVVLSNDIMTISPQEILRTEVELTIIGGTIVYQRKASGF